MKENYVSLFGGSGNDRTSKEYLETIEIGNLLAHMGYVVKNGGYGGMMEAVSKGITDAGGKAIGITCKEVGSAFGNKYLTETIVTNRLYERLELLIDNTSLFIVQRGGIGTLSEVFLALDIIRKDKTVSSPKVLFIGDIWNGVLKSLKNIIPKKEHFLFEVIEDVDDLKKYL